MISTRNGLKFPRLGRITNRMKLISGKKDSNQPLSEMRKRISKVNIFIPITRTPKGEVNQLMWE
jgi:hypothetical protein